MSADVVPTLADDIFDHSEIECSCNDPSCPHEGKEGEVPGHIEECTCAECHRKLGKISPYVK